MAILSKTAFLSKWGTLFADNTTRQISEEDVRDFRQDVSDSFYSLTDDAYTGAKGQRAGVTAPASLKSIVTVAMPFTTLITFIDSTASNVVRVYELVNETTAESSPDVIRPNDYAGTTNEKVWRLRSTVSSGTVTSVTGQNGAVDTTDPANPIVRNGVRTVTSASASVISDNNGLVIFNSATPFNFTLDQLAANTKISFINYGAGVVTFVNGSGVTTAGNLTLAGASGTSYPSALVIYDTLTTPRVISGGSLLTNTLPSTQILVGNGSGVATAVAMSGEATISNTGAVTLSNSAVIGKVLTGFTAGAGTVAGTDTILQALQKIVGNTLVAFTRGANAFGGASDLGLTDNFNLTLQTGVASLLFETNAATRLTITSTGAAAWASTATTSAFVVDSTLGAASAEQIALRIGGVTKFAIRDNGQFTMNPTSGMINTAAGLVWSTSASQNTLYDFATVVNTTNSVTGMRSTFGNYVWSLTSGQSVVGINATGSFAASGGTTSCVSFFANPTFNTTSSYVGVAVGFLYTATQTSVTGLTIYGIRIDIASALNGFGVNAPTATIEAVGGTTGRAPFKLNSGTNLTTAVNGCMEYNGTDLFFTKSGATRGNVLIATAVTTEAVVSDRTLTITYQGTTYKLLALA